MTQRELDQVITAAEAAQLWGLTHSGLQAMLHRGDFGAAARRSAGTWLVTKRAMVERYGEPVPEETRAKGVPVRDVLERLGLRQVADVLTYKDELAGALWRRGRRWYVLPDRAEKVLSRQHVGRD